MLNKTARSTVALGLILAVDAANLHQIPLTYPVMAQWDSVEQPATAEGSDQVVNQIDTATDPANVVTDPATVTPVLEESTDETLLTSTDVVSIEE